MRLRNTILLLLVLYALCPSVTCAQDPTIYSKLYNLPDKFFSRVNSRAKSIEEKLAAQTQKYLTRLARHERKLQKKLWKKDSVAAKALFGDINERYTKLRHLSLNENDVYSGRLDSMQTALRFLEQDKLFNQSPASK